MGAVPNLNPKWVSSLVHAPLNVEVPDAEIPKSWLIVPRMQGLGFGEGSG